MFRNFIVKNLNLIAAFVLILLSQTISAQTFSINGTVISKNTGQPLPAVTIIDKQNNITTITDTKGNFTLNVPDKSVLIFSFTGYKPQEINISQSKTSINVSLEQEDNILNEVVITALGISKEKKSLGYSVQELKSKDISEAKETNLVNELAGKIAGVNVTKSQGDMGSSRIIIR